MTQSLPFTVYHGTFVHPKDLKHLDIILHGSIGVDTTGTIVFVDRESLTAKEAFDKWEKSSKETHSSSIEESNVQFIEISDSLASFFFPGFFDTHIHAPQYPNCGIFGKSTLLDWLETYTFPLESSFQDVNKAKQIYTKVIERTLAYGTTTASYYATIHPEATKIFARLALDKGQRAFVGRVCMNDNSPDYYKDASEEESRTRDLEVIEYIKSIDPEYEIVSPIFTPRFAPSCTFESMKWIGSEMAKTGLPCQTHISENSKEIEWVKELFPQCKNYADVYDQAGLLRSNTILAHAIHLDQDEIEVILKRKSGISHCPISNSSITSGEAPVRKYLDLGIKMSLGTDTSGGFSPSILETARQALLVSRHIAMKTEKEEDKLSVDEVLCMATLGGAQVCGLDNKLGTFEVGKKWDAQLIDLNSKNSPIDVFEWQEKVKTCKQLSPEKEHEQRIENLIAKWLFGGDDRNVTKVWINGRLVKNS